MCDFEILHNLLNEYKIQLSTKIINSIKLELLSELNYTHLSLLIFNNKIIEYGINNINNNKNKQFFTIHSEINLINKYKRSQNKLKKNKKLIVIRLSKNGTIGNSKPCINCIKILRKYMKQLNINYIVYSNENSKLVELSYKDMSNNNLFIYTTGIRLKNKF